MLASSNDRSSMKTFQLVKSNSLLYMPSTVFCPSIRQMLPSCSATLSSPTGNSIKRLIEGLRPHVCGQSDYWDIKLLFQRNHSFPDHVKHCLASVLETFFKEIAELSYRNRQKRCLSVLSTAQSTGVYVLVTLSSTSTAFSKIWTQRRLLHQTDLRWYVRQIIDLCHDRLLAYAIQDATYTTRRWRLQSETLYWTCLWQWL